MSVNNKIKELLNEIKISKEYLEFEKAKKDLLCYPKESNVLDEYKQILLENQLEQFLGGLSNAKQQNKLEIMYEELSKYEVINRFLIAEYKFKNILTNIFKDLNNMIEHSENENNIFFC